MIGPRIPVADAADPQARLLAAFGRSADRPGLIPGLQSV